MIRETTFFFTLQGLQINARTVLPGTALFRGILFIYIYRKWPFEHWLSCSSKKLQTHKPNSITHSV